MLSDIVIASSELADAIVEPLKTLDNDLTSHIEATEARLNKIEELLKGSVEEPEPTPPVLEEDWYEIWKYLTDARPGGDHHEDWKNNYEYWLDLAFQENDEGLTLTQFIKADIIKNGLPLRIVPLDAAEACVSAMNGRNAFPLSHLNQGWGWAKVNSDNNAHVMQGANHRKEAMKPWGEAMANKISPDGQWVDVVPWGVIEKELPNGRTAILEFASQFPAFQVSVLERDEWEYHFPSMNLYYATKHDLIDDRNKLLITANGRVAFTRSDRIFHPYGSRLVNIIKPTTRCIHIACRIGVVNDVSTGMLIGFDPYPRGEKHTGVAYPGGFTSKLQKIPTHRLGLIQGATLSNASVEYDIYEGTVITPEEYLRNPPKIYI